MDRRTDSHTHTHNTLIYTKLPFLRVALGSGLQATLGPFPPLGARGSDGGQYDITTCEAVTSFLVHLRNGLVCLFIRETELRVANNSNKIYKTFRIKYAKYI